LDVSETASGTSQSVKISQSTAGFHLQLSKKSAMLGLNLPK
jgi:hypothetical protein